VVPGLRGSGLAEIAFVKPEPTEEFEAEERRTRWTAQIPMHCVIEAPKVDGLDTTSA
jgi:hypothetical protein